RALVAGRARDVEREPPALAVGPDDEPDRRPGAKGAALDRREARCERRLDAGRDVVLDRELAGPAPVERHRLPAVGLSPELELERRVEHGVARDLGLDVEERRRALLDLLRQHEPARRRLALARDDELSRELDRELAQELGRRLARRAGERA